MNNSDKCQVKHYMKHGLDQKMVGQCVNHKLLNEVLLKRFYRLLHIVKTFVTNNVGEGSLIDHTYEEAILMLFRMLTNNRALQTVKS